MKCNETNLPYDNKIINLRIKNFRSIKDQEVKLAPITLFYGPNGSGKSSLLYSLIIFKNIILNPNRPVTNFFNIADTINLGDFEKVVFDHKKENPIEFEIGVIKGKSSFLYKLTLKENSGIFSLRSEGELNVELSLETQFPYTGNIQTKATINMENNSFEVIWNGLSVQQVNPKNVTKEAMEKARDIILKLNSPLEALRKIEMIPLKRGFFQPYYSSGYYRDVEQELASLLINDKHLASEVSSYLEEILNKQFRVNPIPGSGFFTLDSFEKSSKIVVELVNDGFGTNQLVYLLTKALRKEVDLICIEEPEIHLHPSTIRRLSHAIVNIMKEKNKWFLISTHSETFLISLLSLVARKELKPEELACYYIIKEKKQTKSEYQRVNEKGQIEGGLSSFIEGELEDVKAFLGINDNAS